MRLIFPACRRHLAMFALFLAAACCCPALQAAAPEDVALLRRILSTDADVNRAQLAAKVSDADLRGKVVQLLPEIQAAVVESRRTRRLLADAAAVKGTVELAPGGPEWLREAAGDEAMQVFDLPVGIDLYDGNNPLKGKGGLNTQINDEWLKRIAGFTSVKTLDLANCDVHRAGLEQVATLTQLERLNLTLSSVTDADLAPLAALTELRQLGLASTACTGEGFAALKSLTKLENLNMHHAETNDAGLEAISHVGNLERLWIAHTHFTDAGAKFIAAHKNLRRLGIGSKSPESSGEALAAIVGLPLLELELFDQQTTDAALAYAAQVPTLRLLTVSYGPTVTDASLEAIATLPALEEFRLAGAKEVTDAGVSRLSAMKKLNKLTLTGLKLVTADAIGRLQSARPDLSIQHR